MRPSRVCSVIIKVFRRNDPTRNNPNSSELQTIKPMPEYQINTFGRHCLHRYGMQIGKIALDLGVRCPNRSQNGGCTYCAQASYTPFYLDTTDSISQQLSRGKAYLARKKLRQYFAYFQQETSTAAPVHELMACYRLMLSDPDCIGLIISTRPDYLSSQLLQELQHLKAEKPQKEFLLELGLQSSHERTLKLLNRNHTWQDFTDAVERVRRHDFIQLGVHLILGLPDEDFRDMLATVEKMASLPVDYLKFHHLQIIKGATMAKIFAEKPFLVYSAEEYLQILARLLCHIPPTIVMHRLWSLSDPELLIAPRWLKSPKEIKAMLLRLMKAQNLYQGKHVGFNRINEEAGTPLE